jgi:hypothetical protein
MRGGSGKERVSAMCGKIQLPTSKFQAKRKIKNSKAERVFGVFRLGILGLAWNLEVGIFPFFAQKSLPMP